MNYNDYNASLDDEDSDYADYLDALHEAENDPPMTTPDTENASKLVASVRELIDRPWQAKEYEERVTARTKEFEVAYTYINEHDLACAAVERDIVQEEATKLLDHLATVERDHQLAERDFSELRQRYALLVEAMVSIRDYDIAAHSKYGIEDADEQAKTMHRMRKIARDALELESKSPRLP